MNARIIAGHVLAAALPAAVWEVAINLPAGDPGLLLVLAGFAPFIPAGISLLVGATAFAPSQSAGQVPQQQRRTQPARKELAR